MSFYEGCEPLLIYINNTGLAKVGDRGKSFAPATTRKWQGHDEDV